jgi:hypothetical protein
LWHTLWRAPSMGAQFAFRKLQLEKARAPVYCNIRFGRCLLGAAEPAAEAGSGATGF